MKPLNACVVALVAAVGDHRYAVKDPSAKVNDMIQANIQKMDVQMKCILCGHTLNAVLEVVYSICGNEAVGFVHLHYTDNSYDCKRY